MILRQEFDLLKPSGERSTIAVVLHDIVQVDEGESCCSLECIGFDDKPRSVHGVDGIQALVLALSLARFQLQLLLDRGARILFPGSDDDYDLEIFTVPNHGSSRPRD